MATMNQGTYLQILAVFQGPLQKHHEQIYFNGALMGFVDDDGGEFRQLPVFKQLAQEATLGHVLKSGLLLVFVDHDIATNLVANLLTKRNAHLFRNPLPKLRGGYTLGLRAGHPKPAFILIVDEQLWDLGGLTRSRLAGQDENLVLVINTKDLRKPSIDRQAAPAFE